MSRDWQDALQTVVYERESGAASASSVGPRNEVAPQPVQRLEDRGQIGSGGMCAVHRAFDRTLQRDVALKVMHKERAAKPDAAKRFVEEAQLTAQLDHPHVVPVHDLGMTPDGRPFFTMKVVEGRTFEELLQARDFSISDTRSLGSALRVLLKVCDAVAWAHSRGVLHLDLKPLNVMVGTHGQVHVMDWGIARKLEDLRKNPTATRVAGTRGYMAPEQARGQLGALDARTDVFALGAILYRILAGFPPHGELDRDSALARMRLGDLPPPDAFGAEDRFMPRRLVAICVKATRAQPEERYQTVESFQEELEDFLTGASRFPTTSYRAGAEIIREGDRGDAAFIIVRGRCQVFKGQGPERVPLRVLDRGDIFGETAILTSAARTATVIALEDSLLAVVSREALEEELGRSPLGQQAIHALADRFADLDQRATALTARLAASELRESVLRWFVLHGAPVAKTDTDGPEQRRAAPWRELCASLMKQTGFGAEDVVARVAALGGFSIDAGADRIEWAP